MSRSGFSVPEFKDIFILVGHHHFMKLIFADVPSVAECGESAKISLNKINMIPSDVYRFYLANIETLLLIICGRILKTFTTAAFQQRAADHQRNW